MDRAASPALRLWVVLSRAHAAIEAKAADDVARYGLTLAEFGVLKAVYHKGPMSLGEIRRKCLVSSGGITYLADRLERKGTVKRHLSGRDRRLRYLELTPKGRHLIEQIFPQHAHRLEQVMSGLTPREQGRARALLKRLGLHAEQV